MTSNIKPTPRRRMRLRFSSPIAVITSGARMMLALLLCAGFFILVSPHAEADGANAWVCKYSGKPGVSEVLKPGKNPIVVSTSAVTGTYFADAQESSYVLELQTEQNTSRGQAYSGTKTCPSARVTPITVTLQLSYVADCDVTTNQWRVHNPSTETVTVTFGDATHAASPGDTSFTTPAGAQTLKITWGGGNTGIVAGSDSKESGGTSPNCPVSPQVCVPVDYNGNDAGCGTKPADNLPFDACTDLVGNQPSGFDCAKAPQLTVVDSAGAPNCETKMVELIGTTTTTPFKFENGAWVVDAGNAVSTKASKGFRGATALECPAVVVAPPAQPGVVLPPAVSGPKPGHGVGNTPGNTPGNSPGKVIPGTSSNYPGTVVVSAPATVAVPTVVAAGLSAEGATASSSATTRSMSLFGGGLVFLVAGLLLSRRRVG